MMQLISFLLAAAFIQNLVLSTGFGTSVMLRMSRKRKNILPFSALLCLFTVGTILVCYPLDLLIGTGVAAKWFRPLMIICVDMVAISAPTCSLVWTMPLTTPKHSPVSMANTGEA